MRDAKEFPIDETQGEEKKSNSIDSSSYDRRFNSSSSSSSSSKSAYFDIRTGQPGSYYNHGHQRHSQSSQIQNKLQVPPIYKRGFYGNMLPQPILQQKISPRSSRALFEQEYSYAPQSGGYVGQTWYVKQNHKEGHIEDVQY